jgi:hypothetical protein
MTLARELATQDTQCVSFGQVLPDPLWAPRESCRACSKTLFSYIIQIQISVRTERSDRCECLVLADYLCPLYYDVYIYQAMQYPDPHTVTRNQIRRSWGHVEAKLGMHFARHVSLGSCLNLATAELHLVSSWHTSFNHRNPSIGS